MLLQSFDKIDEARLLEMCKDGCPESQTLEFKREIPGKLDQDKHEICKDVAALANAEGGDLVYGINEKDGVAESIAGISIEPADKAIRRINQVLDAGIEPRIHGLRIQQIPVSEGYALILRVPSSYDGPHCIRTKNNRRFVMRNDTGVVDMSFDQIRGAFDRTASLAEQARRFIANRRQLISEGQAVLPLISGPQLLIHLVPIAGLAGRRTVDLKPIYEKSFTDFIDYDWYGGSRIYNIDGLLVYSADQEENGYSVYNQIFRNGSLEGVKLGGASEKNIQGNEKEIVWSSKMSVFFYYAIKKFIKSVKNWGFTGPALLGVSIVNVKGYELQTSNSFYPRRQAKKADRQHLIPSEVWFEDIDATDIDSIIRSLLDTMWQAFGFDRCYDYNVATGEFDARL
jgi:Putative DNA-binding domain